MKKVFILSLVFLFLSINFFLAYNFLLKNNEDITDENKLVDKLFENKKNIKEAVANPKKIAKIIDEPASFISLDETGGKIKYYDKIANSFWITSFDGSFKNKISDDAFISLSQIDWSDNKKEAILKDGDSFYLYNHIDGARLIKKTKALSWINFKKEVLYTYGDDKTGKRTLNIANPNGSNWREVAIIDDDSMIIKPVPESSKTSFWLKSDSFKESSLNVILAGGGEIEKKGELKFGSDYLWSQGGNKFLRSFVTEKGGNNLVLEVCEYLSNKCTNLNLPTIAPKCVWSKDNLNIFCALPLNIKKDTIMPNDYWANKIFTIDVFWKINTETGKREKIVEEKILEDFNVDATELMLSLNEDFLFFVSKKDSGLFRITL